MFTEEVVKKVWQKGIFDSNNDANEWRKDICGAWIGWKYYGNRNSQYGWEIDHIIPNGDDNIFNLRPLNWRNNLEKSDGKLKYAVIAEGVNNRLC